MSVETACISSWYIDFGTQYYQQAVTVVEGSVGTRVSEPCVALLGGVFPLVTFLFLHSVVPDFSRVDPCCLLFYFNILFVSWIIMSSGFHVLCMKSWGRESLAA